MFISIEQGDGGRYRPFIVHQDNDHPEGEYLMMPCGRGFDTPAEAAAYAERVVTGLVENYQGIWTENGRWV